MMIDASAVVAIITGEVEATQLVKRLEEAPTAFCSHVISQWEATVAIQRKRRCSMIDADSFVSDFLTELDVEILSIDADLLALALDAWQRFGRTSGHKASLNMGDCFSYAVASLQTVPILFVGNDFNHTDLSI